MSNLNLFVDLVSQKSPLQGKTTRAVLQGLSDAQEREGEQLIKGLLVYAVENGFSLETLVDSYLSICNDTRKEQFYFAKKGQYRLADVKAAQALVYEDEGVMRPYMLGLAMTQVFWPHHQKLFDFFCKSIRSHSYSDYLEIGPGHGLFMVEAVRENIDANYTAVDLSKTSIQISGDMLKTFLGADHGVDLLLADIFEWETDRKFDFITVGEVLEHVERPDVMLAKIREYITDDGLVWASTCANCPAIDHVYLFTSADHIRETLRKSGFEIVEEIVSETDTGLRSRAGETIPTTNYAALLRKI